MRTSSSPAFAALAAIDQAYRERYKQDAPSVFAVWRHECDPYGCKPSGLGSGARLDLPGLPFALGVTNDHVTSGGDKFVLVRYDGTTVEATVIATDPRRDLCLLRLKDADGMPAGLKIASDIPEPGSLVASYGFPIGRGGREGNVSVSRGVVRSKQKKDQNGVNTLDYDAQSSPGNSGGPMVNVAGELVGNVVRIHFPSVDLRAYGVQEGICATELAAFLAEINPGTAMSFELLPGFILCDSPGGVAVRRMEGSAKTLAALVTPFQKARRPGPLSLFGLVDYLGSREWRSCRQMERRMHPSRSDEASRLVEIDGARVSDAAQAFDALKGRSRAKLTFTVPGGTDPIAIDYLPLQVSASLPC